MFVLYSSVDPNSSMSHEEWLKRKHIFDPIREDLSRWGYYKRVFTSSLIIIADQVLKEKE